MAKLFDSDYNSNTYFFLTGYSDRFYAGKNSFTINPSPYLVPGQPIFVKVYDVLNNELACDKVMPDNARFAEETNTGHLYHVTVPIDTTNGVGKLQVRGIGLNVEDYSGSVAFYKGTGYKIKDDERLPLTTEPPASNKLQSVEVIWTRNVLIDTTKPTDSEIRFFDTPYIKTRAEIYQSPVYPTGSYRLASGSFSATAVSPKNNTNGDYDYQFDTAIYQLHLKSGTRFSSSMEGEYVRLKNPTVSQFRYNDYQEVFQGTLNTDFVAKISKVVNETSLLLDIPFSTVYELISRSNEDSPYSKNNLVRLKDVRIEDDPDKQVVFHKKNFYILSISDGQFEIFYREIPQNLPRATTSASTKYRSVVGVECNNIRTLCGNLESYKIYARSLNTPADRTLLTQGYIRPDEAIITTKFDSGVYNNPSYFYSQQHMSSHWFVNGSCTFSHDNSVLIDGAYIGHTGNYNETDYVIYKDNTDAASQNAQYVSYSFGSKSYWYANTQAFLNSAIYPTASYIGLTNIPSISSYATSQENVLSGTIHDSNPIKYRQNTLYKFSMRVKAAAGNSADAKLYIYGISNGIKTMIGYIDSAYNYGANELYENTFFNQDEKYGTIMFVPMSGFWYISSVSITPYQDLDYSIDSFLVKIPIFAHIPNEHYEIEVELYDSSQKLAYGTNSYTFTYNKQLFPLKSRIFIDPIGANY
jgi:hypothetical protein